MKVKKKGKAAGASAQKGAKKLVKKGKTTIKKPAVHELTQRRRAKLGDALKGKRQVHLLSTSKRPAATPKGLGNPKPKPSVPSYEAQGRTQPGGPPRSQASTFTLAAPSFTLPTTQQPVSESSDSRHDSLRKFMSPLLEQPVEAQRKQEDRQKARKGPAKSTLPSGNKFQILMEENSDDDDEGMRPSSSQPFLLQPPRFTFQGPEVDAGDL